ncbi:MAG: hypothetical protein ACE145_19205 [Terriglobia bacterium]
MEKYRNSEQSYVKATSFHPAMPVNFRPRLAHAYLKTRQIEKAQSQSQADHRDAPEGSAAERVRKTLKRLETNGPSVTSHSDAVDIQGVSRIASTVAVEVISHSSQRAF